MDKIKEITVYRRVKVEDELPPIEPDKHTATYYMTNNGTMWLNKQHKVWYRPGMSIADPHEQPEIWMKEQKGFFLNRLELEELLQKAITLAWTHQEIRHTSDVNLCSDKNEFSKQCLDVLLNG